ncbi:MAG: tRNA (5-methylaminomethyl-2-thiouridine)(34)-methyltransferase MnmD [Chitinophagales bacterium]|nr:tRNA (5-methylaminomethyl-2-thiouridine)(34)-methyltransferase MnmD [Chitinophagales bacterium]
MGLKLITTADGSHTLYVEELDEHYHSLHGAIQESKHVYIQAGFEQLHNQPSIDILEMGFGTGLNALLTALVPYCGLVRYSTVEAYPLEQGAIDALNYAVQLGAKAGSLFHLIHHSPWGVPLEVNPSFFITKLKGSLQAQSFAHESFDLVYYDAFAPTVQPELWQLDILTQVAKWMRPKGILVTYCAQGSFKRHLKQLGFTVEAIPGPPGKKEMTRAIKL